MLVEPTPSSTAMPDLATPLRPVRAAVAGLGRTGIVHAAVLSALPNVEIVALGESRARLRREARGVGFEVPLFDRLAPLIAKSKPEALIVSVPLEARAGWTREALEAGVAVLSERPLAPSLAESEALVLLARERSVPLACASELAFHPVFAETRAILRAAALGEPRRVRCSTYHSLVFSPERQSAAAEPGSAGGVFAHEALDALSYLIETLGPPLKARATAQRIFGPLEDEVHVFMTLASGADVGLDASWSVPGHPTRSTVLELEGENGKLLASDDAVELDLVEERLGFRAGHARLGLADLPQPARFDLEGESTYLTDAAFLAWVAGGEPPVHRAEAALRAHRAMEAIYASLKAGGTVVPLASP